MPPPIPRSPSASPLKDDRHSPRKVTPASSFTGPLTPPATDEKNFPHAKRVLEYFRDIYSDKRERVGEQTWILFVLGEGEYDEVVRRLECDANLNGFVRDKVRYDYDESTRELVIRMPSFVHETFRGSLKEIHRNGLMTLPQWKEQGRKDFCQDGMKRNR